MLRRIILTLTLISGALASGLAQDREADISWQQQIYREINERLAGMQKTAATLRTERGKVSLTGWADGGDIRKITATPGLGGSGFVEFYLEEGQPLFVFSTAAAMDRNIEDRIYLQDGEIVKWASTDPSFVAHAEDCATLQERLASDLPRYAAALGGAGERSEGMFVGVEQGDYAHWKLREADGTERSFFILETDAAIDRVLADPQEFEGRQCVVRWDRRKESMPEAGATMDIDVLLSVEWR